MPPKTGKRSAPDSDELELGHTEVSKKVVVVGPALPRQGFERYHDDPEFSDITIELGTNAEIELHGHKVILANCSRWFRAAFKKDWNEAGNNAIRLHDEPVYNPALVALIRHIYGMPYKEDEVKDDPAFDVLVYIMADKYEVPTLRDVIMRRHLYYKSDSDGGTFCEAIQLVFDHTFADTRLYTRYLQFCVQHHEVLSDEECFRNLMKDAPEILYKIWREGWELKNLRRNRMAVGLGTARNPYGIE